MASVQIINTGAALAKKAMQEAKDEGGPGAYTILLMITDGIITDFEVRFGTT